MEMQWSRGRCQPGRAALRAGCHIWAKITHNAPNWIKQSWRIFYSCFHPGSCSLVAFPYSCPPRIPFFELHPRTFATISLHPNQLSSCKLFIFLILRFHTFFSRVDQTFWCCFSFALPHSWRCGEHPRGFGIWDLGGDALMGAAF